MVLTECYGSVSYGLESCVFGWLAESPLNLQTADTNAIN